MKTFRTVRFSLLIFTCIGGILQAQDPLCPANLPDGSASPTALCPSDTMLTLDIGTATTIENPIDGMSVDWYIGTTPGFALGAGTLVGSQTLTVNSTAFPAMSVTALTCYVVGEVGNDGDNSGIWRTPDGGAWTTGGTGNTHFGIPNGPNPGTVLINQVQPDPDLNNGCVANDGEFIELVGPAGFDLGGWVLIERGTSEHIRFAPGTTFPADGIFVIADSSVMGTIPNSEIDWDYDSDAAGACEANGICLTDGGGFLMLFNPNGEFVDGIDWAGNDPADQVHDLNACGTTDIAVSPAVVATLADLACGDTLYVRGVWNGLPANCATLSTGACGVERTVAAYAGTTETMEMEILVGAGCAECVACVDLTKEADLVGALSGETITYTLTASNCGGVVLTSVVLTDSLVAGTLSAPTSTNGDTDTANGMDADEVWTWTATYLVTDADVAAGMQIVNTASISADSAVGSVMDGAEAVVCVSPSCTKSEGNCLIEIDFDEPAFADVVGAPIAAGGETAAAGTEVQSPTGDPFNWTYGFNVIEDGTCNEWTAATYAGRPAGDLDDIFITYTAINQTPLPSVAGAPGAQEVRNVVTYNTTSGGRFTFLKRINNPGDADEDVYIQPGSLYGGQLDITFGPHIQAIAEDPLNPANRTNFRQSSSYTSTDYWEHGIGSFVSDALSARPSSQGYLFTDCNPPAVPGNTTGTSTVTPGYTMPAPIGVWYVDNCVANTETQCGDTNHPLGENAGSGNSVDPNGTVYASAGTGTLNGGPCGLVSDNAGMNPTDIISHISFMGVQEVSEPYNGPENPNATADDDGGFRGYETGNSGGIISFQSFCFVVEQPQACIGLAKEVAPVTCPNEDGTIDLEFTLQVCNAEDAELTRVQVIDDISQFIPSANIVNISAATITTQPPTGTLTLNAMAWDGTTNIRILDEANSNLPGNECGEIAFTVTVTADCEGMWTNQATAWGMGQGICTYDISYDDGVVGSFALVDGANPDYDSSGDGAADTDCPNTDDSPTILAIDATGAIVADCLAGPIEISIPDSGTVSLVPGDVLNLATLSSPCGFVSTNITPAEFTCDTTGPQSITITLMDVCGDTTIVMCDVSVLPCTEPGITVGKSCAGPACPNDDGFYEVVCDIDVANSGTAPLLSVSILDSLTSAFGPFLVSGSITAFDNVNAANVTANAGFNGSSSTDLIGAVAAPGFLPGETFTVTVTVILEANACKQQLVNNLDYEAIDDRDRSVTGSIGSAPIFVGDFDAPRARCSNITVGPGGSTFIDPEAIDAGSSDNCGIVRKEVTPLGPISCDQAGEFPVTFTVYDACGNSDSCMATVTVVSCDTMISGFVRFDEECERGIDNSEAPIAGVTVSLYSDPDCDGNLADGAFLQTATTDISGLYTFSGLEGGCFVVVQTDLPGYWSTTDVGPGSNVNEVAVSLTCCMNMGGINFWDTKPYSNYVDTVVDECCEATVYREWTVGNLCGCEAMICTQVITLTKEIELPPCPVRGPFYLGCNPTLPVPDPGVFDFEGGCDITVSYNSYTQVMDGCLITRTNIFDVEDICGNATQCFEVLVWTEDVEPPVPTSLPTATNTMDCVCIGDPLNLPDPTNNLSCADNCEGVGVVGISNTTMMVTNMSVSFVSQPETNTVDVTTTNDIVTMVSTMVIDSIVTTVDPAYTTIQINEVLSDAAGAEGNVPDGGEFIELVGPPGFDLSCWVITDGDFTLTIPNGFVIPADGIVFIAVGAYTGAADSPCGQTTGYSDIDIDVGTCGCLENSTWNFTNTGEHFGIYSNDGSFVSGLIFGSPNAGNSPSGDTSYPISNTALGACPSLSLSAAPNASYAVAGFAPSPDESYQLTDTGYGTDTACATPGMASVGQDVTTVVTNFITMMVPVTNEMVVVTPTEVVTFSNVPVTNTTVNTVVTPSIVTGAVGCVIEHINDITNITPCEITVTRIWRFSDACGNFVEREQVYLFPVNDKLPPVCVSGPTNTYVGCNPGGDVHLMPITPNMFSFSDPCGIDVVWVSNDVMIASGPCFFQRDVTVAARDFCGNVTSKTVSITWNEDVVPPVITGFPVSVDLGCNPTAADLLAATPTEASFTVQENCGIATQIFTCTTNELGCVTVIRCSLTVIDECGNADVKEAGVSWIEDTEPPVITCPLDPAFLGCNPTIPAPDPLSVTATDTICGDVEVSFVGDSHTFQDCRTFLERVYQASDFCGNISTCTQRFEFISDLENPEIAIQPADVVLGCQLDDRAAINALIDNTLVTVDDNCDMQSTSEFSRVETTQDCVIVITRTLQFIDVCGNTKYANQYFYFSEAASVPPPMCSGRAPVALGCNPTLPLPDPSRVSPYSECGIVLVDFDRSEEVQLGCTYFVTNFYTATDVCGETATCTESFSYTLDLEPPTIESFPTVTNMGICVVPGEAIPMPPSSESLIVCFDECAGTPILSSSNVSMETVSTNITMGSTNSSPSMLFVSAILVDTVGGERDEEWVDLTYLGCPGAGDLDLSGWRIEDEFTDDPDDGSSSFILAAGTILAPGATLRLFTVNSTNRSGSFWNNGGDTVFVFDDSDAATEAGDTLVTSFGWTSGPGPGNVLTNMAYTSALLTQDCTVTAPTTNVMTNTVNTTVVITNGVTECDIVLASVITNIQPCIIEVVRTYQIMDACGNFIERDEYLLYNVNDETGPVFLSGPISGDLGCNPEVSDTFPITAADTTWSESCGLDAVWIDSTATVAVTSCTWSQDVFYAAADLCGNTTTTHVWRTWTRDEVAPVITGCPNNVDLGCFLSAADFALAVAAIAPQISEVTATDNCDVVVSVIHLGDATKQFGCDLTVTRLFRAIDSCGNAVDHKQTFHGIVNDGVGPVLVGPSDLALGCIDTLADIPQADPGLVTAIDPCGVQWTIHASDTTNDLGCASEIVRVYSSLDICDNLSVITQRITYSFDMTAPVVVSAPPLERDIGCIALGQIPPADPSLVVGTDACGYAITVTRDITNQVAGGCDQWELEREFTLTDPCGNFVTRTERVRYRLVDDIAPPMCMPVGPTDLGCNPVVPPPDTARVTPMSPCPMSSVKFIGSQQAQDGCSFIQTNTYESIDVCGRVAVCTEVFTWTEDIDEPEIVAAPADATIPCGGIAPTVAEDMAAFSITDACGATLTLSVAVTNDRTCSSDILRRYTAVDACGNTTDYDVNYSVLLDPADLTINCPEGFDLGCNPDPADLPTQASLMAQIIATSACGTTVEPQIRAISATRCERSMVHTFIAYDQCGNSVTSCPIVHTWTEDTWGPEIVSAPPSFRDLGCIDTADAVPAANNEVLVARDNCGDPTVTVISDFTNQIGICEYEVERIYQAADGCDQKTFHNVRIVYRLDNDAPVIDEAASAPALVDLRATCTATIPVPDPIGSVSATDNGCGIDRIEHVGDSTTFGGCFIDMTRLYRAWDQCGNYSDHTQTFRYVDDQIPPVVVLTPQDIILGCEASIGDVPPPFTELALASDNCLLVSTQHFSDQVITNGCAITVTRTYEFEDFCGNVAYGSQNIHYSTGGTVAPPTCASMGPVDLGCNPTIPSPDETAVTPNSDCGIVSVDYTGATITTNGCFYSLTYSYDAVDVCGQTVVCEQAFVYTLDTENPIVTAYPADQDLGCNPAIPSVEDDLAAFSFSDNCSAVLDAVSAVTNTIGCDQIIQRAFRVIDGCGNEVLHQLAYTLRLDDVAPTFTPPADVSLECLALTTPADTGEPTGVSDSCAGAIAVDYVDTVSTGACTAAYSIERLWTATDFCGNVALHTQLITVVDTTPPVLSCKPSPIMMPHSENCDGVIPDVLGTVSDTCGTVTTVQIPAPGTVVDIGDTFVTLVATDDCGNSATCMVQVTVLGPCGQPDITLLKTVYLGHDDGAGCPSSVEKVIGPHDGDVTYCFVIENTGSITLENVELNDTDISPTFQQIVIASLAPGATHSVYLERTIDGSLLNNAQTIGYPENGLPAVFDNDTAEVDEKNPDITLVKTVSLDGTCPGLDYVDGFEGTPVTYCFSIENTGDTILSNVMLKDDVLGLVQTFDGTLAPGAITNFSMASTIEGYLLNEAWTFGTPVGDDLQPIGLPDVEDHDTAEVNTGISLLEGVVWIDLSNDGDESNENLQILGIPNAQVDLFEVVGGVTNYLSSTFTDANGYYVFDNLPAGEFFVAVDPSTIPPELTIQSTPSDYGVLLGINDEDDNNDFGFLAPATAINLTDLGAEVVADGVALSWTLNDADALGVYVLQDGDVVSDLLVDANAFTVPGAVGGSYSLRVLASDLSSEDSAAVRATMDAEAVGEPTLTVVAEAGTATFTAQADVLSYFVLEFDTAPVVLDVTNDRILIGNVVEVDGGFGVYFSAPAGTKLRVTAP